MAADETNRFLFLDETGKSVQFYMPSCPERKTLRPIIESGGGEISNKIVPGCIKLARPGQKVHSDDLINCKYVTDCVEQDELLDVEDYRIPADTVASDEGDKVSDIEMDIDNHIMNLPPRAKKGRTKYLLSEDLKIVRYILDEELYNETSGNAMWQEMGILKIVNHTWQSMRDHFLKVIIPNIRSYQLNSREIALLTQTAATNWDKDSGSGQRPSKSPSPKKATTSATRTESSPPKKKAKRASDTDDSDSASTLAPDIPVVFDNLDRELLALAMDEDPHTEGSDQGPALSEDKEPAPCEVVQIQSTSKKRQRLARASTITTSTATSTTSPEKTQTENPTSPAQEGPAEKEEEDITKESDEELMPGQPFKSPPKKVPASEPAESVIVVLDASDDEEYEESQSVLEPQPTERVRGLRSRDTEASEVSNRNNNATTASTGQEEAARPKRATRSRIDYLKNFVHDPVSSQPETQQVPSSPESEEIDQQHMKKIERKVDKVCQWLSIRREELLDVLWTTSGSLDDAVNWILSGGSDLVPVWTPDDDMMLQGGDERDLCELEGKFGPTGIDTRLSFTAETSS